MIRLGTYGEVIEIASKSEPNDFDTWLPVNVYLEVEKP